nr:unnamed protein product [Callosobruchus analis]
MNSSEEEKEASKAVPLDLAKSQVTTVKTIESKSPLVMSSQSLRGVRVLSQTVSNPNAVSLGNAIITTSLISQAVLKPVDSSRPTTTTQSLTTSNLSRPAQITFSPAAPLIAQSTSGTSYHVPRGPAVVANLAAPRSNVTTVRAPMVVTAQSNQPHAFVRPQRPPNAGQGTAWLTNTQNGSQIKGASTVLSSPVKGAMVTGKPQIIARTQGQPITSGISSIRPNTILQSTITIGQSGVTGQMQPFKPGGTTIQTLGTTVAQVLPNRTQAVVYTANTPQFTPTTRITVSNTTLSAQRLPQTRITSQVPAARLTVPMNVSQSCTRLVAPQTTVLTSGMRLSTVSTSQQPTVLSSTPATRITTQPSGTIGRLSVATAPTVSTANILGSTRISTLNLQNLHSLVAVANSAQQRNVQAQVPKVITQPAQGTIHLTPLSTTVKTTPSIVTTIARTINVPSVAVSQRQTNVLPSQAVSIAKVFNQATDVAHGTSPATTTANVFIHTPSSQQQPIRRTSQSPTPVSGTCFAPCSSTAPATTVATYTLASGTYFYDNSTSTYSVNRNFANQQPFTTLATQNVQQQAARQTPVLSSQQVHGVAGSNQPQQPLRFNPMMVVEQSQQPQRPSSQPPAQSQTFQQTFQASAGVGVDPQPLANAAETLLQQQAAPKTTSSPRPSILRKRDHEGAPLKAAKNLQPVLATIPSAQQQQQPPLSPPSRPDSRGNGHSSGGSTTISATSSPGIAEINEDSNHATVVNNLKEEEESKPPLEMSPRKKPRKQQLTGNDLDEHNDDMQFISESTVKKENEDSDANHSDEVKDRVSEVAVTTVRKPASVSLLNSYRQNWKATHNHYLRHSDVRPKDERRPSIMDLANQYRVQEKINGWKIHHLTTQMEDLADQEQGVYNQLTELLKCTESEENCRQYDKEINRVNELIKGNLQRIKIINDGMIEAKSQIMKIFDHKVHVMDIINRCASKRNFKKREKS